MLDSLLALLGMLLIGLGIYRRFIGAAFLLAGVYVATLISAISYRAAAYRLKAIGHEAIWFKGLIFIILYLLTLLIFFIATRIAFPDTSLPKWRFLDPLLGLVLGVLTAAISLALVYRAFGYMVSQEWEPFATYSQLYVTWAGSRIGPLVDRLLSVYLYLLYPFFMRQGLPPVLQ